MAIDKTDKQQAPSVAGCFMLAASCQYAVLVSRLVHVVQSSRSYSFCFFAGGVCANPLGFLAATSATSNGPLVRYQELFAHRR